MGAAVTSREACHVLAVARRLLLPILHHFEIMQTTVTAHSGCWRRLWWGADICRVLFSPCFPLERKSYSTILYTEYRMPRQLTVLERRQRTSTTPAANKRDYNNNYYPWAKRGFLKGGLLASIPKRHLRTIYASFFLLKSREDSPGWASEAPGSDDAISCSALYAYLDPHGTTCGLHDLY